MSAMDRRRFVAGSLASGFAAAVLPVSATTLTTSSEGLAQGESEIPVGDTLLPAYWARPQQGEAWPLVIVVQEIFGVHEHIRDVCRRFAHRGVLAVAPELFVRQGDPSQVGDISQLMRDIVSRVPDAQVMADLDATMSWARSQGATDAAAITGFCWGGRISWLYAAHQPAIRAAVAWYGRLTGTATELQPRHPLDLAADLKAPVLGLYGGLDRGIPLQDVQQMQHALQQEGVSEAARTSRFVVYPEAGHGFHADYRPSYRDVDARAAFAECCLWMRDHGIALDTRDV